MTVRPAHLNGPLGLPPTRTARSSRSTAATEPGRDHPSRRPSRDRTLDTSGTPPGAGALFGLALTPGHRAVYFVDDATNTLNLLH